MRRRIVVTGASSGIGRAAAVRLASRGHALGLVARREGALLEVKTECEAAGGSAEIQPLDLSNPASADRLPDLAARLGEGQLCLLNAAGIAAFGHVAKSEPSDFLDQINLNLIGLMLACRALVPEMLAAGSGQVVNVLSVVAVQVFPGAAAYSASKAGALAFTRCLNQEVRRQGVRVASVMPGAVDTPIWNDKGWSPPQEDMLPVSAVAEAIESLIEMPPDRSVNELLLMPPKGVL